MFAKDKPSHAAWWYLQGSLSWGAGAMAEEAVSLPGALGADDYCWCVYHLCSFASLAFFPENVLLISLAVCVSFDQSQVQSFQRKEWQKKRKKRPLVGLALVQVLWCMFSDIPQSPQIQPRHY